LPKSGDIDCVRHLLNLRRATEAGRIEKGDYLLLFTFGYGSNWACMGLSSTDETPIDLPDGATRRGRRSVAHAHVTRNDVRINVLVRRTDRSPCERIKAISAIST
jgi:hypothetical protein